MTALAFTPAPAGSELAPGAAPTDEPTAGASAPDQRERDQRELASLRTRLDAGEQEKRQLRAKIEDFAGGLARADTERDRLQTELAAAQLELEVLRGPEPTPLRELAKPAAQEQIIQQTRAERDAARAELEVTREALRWARSTAAVVDDVLRSRDRLGSKLGVLRGKYREALAAQRQLTEEHAQCASEPAQLRIAELEAKVKEVTSRGADILINRNAIAARVLGWASELCGDRPRTIDQALADVDAALTEVNTELARLAEQRDSTGQALVTVTRERDEARRQLAEGQHGTAAARPEPAVSRPIVELLNKLLAVDFAAAVRFLGLDDVFLSKRGDLILRGRGAEERARFDPEQLVHDQIADLNARLRARQPTAAELAPVPGLGAEVLS